MTSSSRDSSSRAFWTFWAATMTSQFGSGLTLVAFPLIAVSLLDASAFEVGLLSAAGYVGWLVLGLPSGVIVQRLPLRAVQVSTDLVRAAAILTIPLAYAFDGLTIAHLVAVAVVVGCSTVLFDVGNSTFLPAIVSREELTARNSLISGTQAATQMGAPSMAGVLVQVIGAIPTLLFDVVSYVVSAVLLRSLPERRAPRGPAAPMWSSIAEGWRFVRHHPVMFPCVGWATVTNFACGALLALTPLYLVRVLDASPISVGLLIAADGFGSLIGATFTTRLVRRLEGTARAMIAATVAGGLTALLMPLAQGYLGMALFAVGNAGFAAGVVVGSIVTRTHRQTETPDNLLARVMATVRFVSWGATPVGALFAGSLATIISIHAALWVACLLGLAAPLWLLASRIRGLSNLTDVDPIIH